MKGFNFYFLARYHFKINVLCFSLLLGFAYTSAHAQLFELPNVLGFEDMILQGSCSPYSSDITTQDSPSNKTILPVYSGTNVDLSVKTGGRRETLELYSSHPHILHFPEINIGDRRQNWTTARVQTVSVPTLIRIKARIKGDLRTWVDEDFIMAQPPLKFDGFGWQPEVTEYRSGSIITLAGKLNQNVPLGVVPILLSRPYAIVNSQRILLESPDWDLAELMGSSVLRTDVDTYQSNFEMSFVAEWPNDPALARFPNMHLTFTARVAMLSPDFCSPFAQGVFWQDVKFKLKNPNFTIRRKIDAQLEDNNHFKRMIN